MYNRMNYNKQNINFLNNSPRGKKQTDISDIS